MLKAIENAVRERKCLNGVWRFAVDGAGCGREQHWWQAVLPEARDMPVPASYNDIVPGRSLHDHVGDVWYQTTARVPRGWAASALCFASTPPPTAPRCGWVTPKS
jgi:beta-glucuronidase